MLFLAIFLCNIIIVQNEMPYSHLSNVENKLEFIKIVFFKLTGLYLG